MCASLHGLMMHNNVASKAFCSRARSGSEPVSGAGVIWRPWPTQQALSSASGSSLSRCLSTSAPALWERGKGEGGKDATDVNNPHLQQLHPQRSQFGMWYSTRFISRDIYIHLSQETTGSQRFYPSPRREMYYGEGLAYEYKRGTRRLIWLAERQSLEEWALPSWPVND